MAEKEYIERGAMREFLCEKQKGLEIAGCINIAKDFGRVIKLIDEGYIPTADVVEVVHAEWIYHECVSSYDGTKSGYSCSACNAFVEEEVFETDEFHKIFCGNCGAKMDGERKEYQ